MQAFKQPNVVAIQFNENDLDAARAFALEDFDHDEGESAVLSEPGGAWRTVYDGDWIVKYPDGDFRIFPDHDFQRIFRPV